MTGLHNALFIVRFCKALFIVSTICNDFLFPERQEEKLKNNSRDLSFVSFVILKSFIQLQI